MTNQTLYQLEQLNRERTQGPWKYDGWGYLWGPNMAMIADTDDEEAYLARMRGVGSNLPIQQNMDFITTLANNATELLKLARAGMELARDLEEEREAGGDDYADGIDQALANYRKNTEV